jgi:CubicO group peptidase (beta-lactamase class C family)
LLAQGVIDKRLSLDDDIRKYLPGSFPNLQFEGKPILIRHLATHTSGLQPTPPRIPDDATADDYKNYTRAMLFEDLAIVKVNSAPGSLFSYSNLGGGLCGPILEKAFGMPYEKLLQKYIFGPARMKDSGITLTSSMDRNYATGHDAAGVKTDRWTVNGIESAGAVRSDAVDMIRYARLNLEEKNPAVLLSHQVLTPDGADPMGIFWGRRDSRTGGRTYTHEGGTGGFSTNIIVMPDTHFAVVVMTNSLDQPCQQLGYEIALRVLNGRK